MFLSLFHYNLYSAFSTVSISFETKETLLFKKNLEFCVCGLCYSGHGARERFGPHGSARPLLDPFSISAVFSWQGGEGGVNMT